MIMSIGFELRIDEIKSFEEIPSSLTLSDLIFKLLEDIIIFKNTFNPIAYQNILDDYFHLGFRLNISLDEMIDSYK